MNKQTKYTKGPWKATTWCVWGPNNEYVAATKTGIDEEEEQANAQLIAKTPQIIDALEDMIALVESMDGFDPCEGEKGHYEYSKARSVIEMAKG